MVREIIAACAEKSLEALGLVDASLGDPDLTELLEFGRARLKPWAEDTANRGIEVPLCEPLFAHLSTDDRKQLAARLKTVIEERMNGAASGWIDDH